MPNNETKKSSAELLAQALLKLTPKEQENILCLIKGMELANSIKESA